MSWKWKCCFSFVTMRILVSPRAACNKEGNQSIYSFVSVASRHSWVARRKGKLRWLLYTSPGLWKGDVWKEDWREEEKTDYYLKGNT